MQNLSKRRIYVMDCGGFVKIGVSNDVERRKSQIPFKVKQYYCTEPLSNAFEIEKTLHEKFSKFRVESIKGREYFNVSFKRATSRLRELTDAEYAKEVEERKKKETIEMLCDSAQKLSLNDVSYLLGLSIGLQMQEQFLKNSTTQTRR